MRFTGQPAHSTYIAGAVGTFASWQIATTGVVGSGQRAETESEKRIHSPKYYSHHDAGAFIH